MKGSDVPDGVVIRIGYTDVGLGVSREMPA
jgi:hypothetical protein